MNTVAERIAELLRPSDSRGRGIILAEASKLLAAPAAPSRGDPLADVAKAIRACEGHSITYGLGMKMSEVLKWIESLSSQEGK